MTQLKIFEIFYSLQGESSRVGLPTIFIRLSGCPMRCHYCDTAYAFQGGSMMTIDEIMEAIKKYHTHYVTVTGGEPLAQKEVLNLLKVLADQNFKVSLETGGGLSIKEVDPRIKIILDIKTPESGEEKKNYWENLNFIHLKDEIKFVLCSREDYDWAKKIINQYNPQDFGMFLLDFLIRILITSPFLCFFFYFHLPVSLFLLLSTKSDCIED